MKTGEMQNNHLQNVFFFPKHSTTFLFESTHFCSLPEEDPCPSSKLGKKLQNNRSLALETQEAAEAANPIWLWVSYSVAWERKLG